MLYARTLSAPRTVKAKMFGLVNRCDVERAVKEAREDVYAANVADYRESQIVLVKIVRAASRPSDQTNTKPKDVGARPAP